MSSSTGQPMISEAIESARRARLVSQLKMPDKKQVPGHRWKLICDIKNAAATLEVDIGGWKQPKRTFYPSHQFTYAVPFSAGRDSFTYTLEIKTRIEESYHQAKVNPRVFGEEFYDDIIVEAHFAQAGSTDHKQIIADHPSMQFGTMQAGADFQFMVNWKNPSFPQEWSNPFGLRKEVTLRNTAIHLFEEKPIRSYSLFEVDGGNNRLTPISHEVLAPQASGRIQFQLTPAKLTLSQPKGLHLQKFIVDPKYGQGD